MCQKASTTYRGRDYVVWFTPEIPVSHGPWKLRGLPGLIIEASDLTGKYEFIARKINMNPNNNEVKEKLKRPNTDEIRDMDVYIEALKNSHKEMKAIIKATMMSREAKFREGCDTCPDPKKIGLELYN